MTSLTSAPWLHGTVLNICVTNAPSLGTVSPLAQSALPREEGYLVQKGCPSPSRAGGQGLCPHSSCERSVLASCGCCDRLPQAWWLPTTVHSLILLQASSPKSKCWQGHAPSKGWGAGQASVPTSSSFGVPGMPWRSHMASSVSPPLCFSYTDTGQGVRGLS